MTFKDTHELGMYLINSVKAELKPDSDSHVITFGGYRAEVNKDESRTPILITLEVYVDLKEKKDA